MVQAACPRSMVDPMHSKPQVQAGKRPLPAPGQRQKSQLFLRSGVESVLSLPIQSPGVIPLIQRCPEQHPLDLLCLEQGSMVVVHGLDVRHFECKSVGPSHFLCPSLDAEHPEYSGAIPCLVQGVQLCIRDNTLGGNRSKLRWGLTSCAIFRALGANLCELGCALTFTDGS